MSTAASFSCSIGTTDPARPLGLEIWFDQDKIFDQLHVQEPTEFHYDFADSNGEHELRFVMKNKQQDYTTVDESGAIIQDACITIDRVAFDQIPLGYAMVKQSKYTHDFNGTGTLAQVPFYGIMGCNGTVSLSFTTPIYLWLLEHL